MSKLPSMPLWVDAYLADTAHLSIEESGAYLHILMAMWRHNGFIPDDDKDNARICKVSPYKWARLKKRIIPLLMSSGGRLSQKRLQKEWNYSLENSERQREKGKRSGEVRKQRSQLLSSNHGSSAVATGSQPKSNRNPTPIPNIDIIEKPSPTETTTELTQRLLGTGLMNGRTPFKPVKYRRRQYQ
jgi:uncharacterized protein YdaU (DUF1376 family)